MAASLVLFSSPVRAVDAGVRGFYWFADFNGDARIDEGSIEGTRVDFEKDLDIDGDGVPGGEFFLGAGKHLLTMSYYSADFDGSAKLERNITFNGDTFLEDEIVTSSLEYDVYDLNYSYKVLDLENVLAGFSLGLNLRFQGYDGTAAIRSSRLHTEEDFSAAVPMVGGNIHVGFLAGVLEGRLVATGITYGNGTAVDAQADLSYTPAPFIDIHGGYRIFFIDVDHDDEELDYDTSGPYAAVTLSF